MSGRMGAVIPEYLAHDLGAPFDVVLVDSALRRGVDVTIPDFQGMVREAAATRLRQSHRASGADARFLRRAAGLDVDRTAAAIGMAPEALRAVEEGPRPLTAASERCLRIAVMNRLRRDMPDGLERMIAYLDWALDVWRPGPHVAGADRTVRLRHDPATGWRAL